MAEIDLTPTVTQIEVGELLPKVMELKKEGMRLSQACAAYIDDKFELSYSFADDVNYAYKSLRLVIDTDTEVPSITEVVPSAVFYENEMKEIFGVRINMISLDYNNKLYRINVENPLGPGGKDKED
ncbi:MAG: NADH-quinone oxidoreductase subunit C [Eubacterium sp.]|nr:NADH-quinone oxidoreductase subunit C [Eubacterium sp.]